MGEIADMMLEGLLDEETGEYIGDQNTGVFGDESPGFPVSYRYGRPYVGGKPLDAAPDKSKYTRDTKMRCPFCNRKVRAVGFSQHYGDKHLGREDEG